MNTPYQKEMYLPSLDGKEMELWDACCFLLQLYNRNAGILQHSMALKRKAAIIVLELEPILVFIRVRKLLSLME